MVPPDKDDPVKLKTHSIILINLFEFYTEYAPPDYLSDFMY
jgi:hypothetical protein